MKLRIATRKSPLAIWQAQHIKQLLLKNHPDLVVELVPMTTQGDRVSQSQDKTPAGKGLFVKELESALLSDKADIAVHSMKDVPMFFPDGLALAVICQRDDPRDALIAIDYKDFNDLPPGAQIGTSSLRRQCQLKALRPELKMKTLRGNVNTRINKLKSGEYDAIILAAAGLHRLELTHTICEYFSTEKVLPAPGQGALGIECKVDNDPVLKLIEPLNDTNTALCVHAERTVVKVLEWDCQLPMACYAQLANSKIFIRGCVGTAEGEQMISGLAEGLEHQGIELGNRLADTLIQQGAKEILQRYLSNQ